MAAQGASTTVTSPNISKVTVKLANFLVHRLKDNSEALNVIEVGLAEQESSYELYITKLKIAEMGSNIDDILNVCDEAIENVTSAAETEYFINQKSVFHDIYGRDVETSELIKNQLLEANVEKFANISTTCIDCNITFSSTAILKRHLLSHEKMHNCPKCKKKFTSLSIFQSHKSVCRFTCSVCGKTYVKKSGLQNHVNKCMHRQDVQ
jgi:hypothetical protein